MNFNLNKITCRILAAVLLVTALPQNYVQAALPRLNTTQIRVEPINNQYYSKVLDFSHIVPVKMGSTFTAADFIPMDLQPTRNVGKVANRIIDHAMNHLSKHEMFRSSTLVRTAEDLNQFVDTKIELGSEKGVKQDLRLQLRPFETQAKLAYSGHFNADLSYQVSSDTLSLEVYQKLGRDSRVALQHKKDREQTYNGVAVELTF